MLKLKFKLEDNENNIPKTVELIRVCFGGIVKLVLIKSHCYIVKLA